MPSTSQSSVHPRLHFDRFLSSTFCRAVARFLIVTLLAWDLPRPRIVGMAQTAPTLLYVNATDVTCQGQSPCFPTIQQAIDAAQPGDAVRVQAGAYDEALLIKKKQNLMLEADPTAPEGSVMLDSVSQRCGRGDVISIIASADITIRGFTITDAGGQAVDIKGGGLKKHNQHIVIERNRIFGNGASQCQGGIRVGANTPDTVILNNLIYGNGQDAIRFLGGKGGPHYVVQNVIHGNRRSGIDVTKGQTVAIINNLITRNGADPKPLKQLFGIRRPAPKRKSRAENAQLLHNLICGNSQGELFGPMLDGLDAGNLTPTGEEDQETGGTSVAASPQCGDVTVVYANVNGLDGQPNTKDDDFTLAAHSPAIDVGADPRAQGIPIPDANLEQDFFREGIRPGDGDHDGAPVFDIGAIEEPGPQCQPGTTEPCYEGPVGTDGVGLCHGGARTCQPDGTFGVCENQVLPGAEVCNGQDDDCDGQVDEGDACVAQCAPGAACDTGAPGICAHGQITCPDGPTGDSVCIQTVTPGTEVCGNTTDEDCDGQVNEPEGCPAPNAAPRITSTPLTASTVGQPYSYDVNATDPDASDILTFSLPLGPAGMTIDPGSGVVQWTPGSGQDGRQDVTAQVADGQGGLDFQTFIVDVAAVNAAPTANDDAYEARVGETLNTSAPGVMENDTDPNNDPLQAMLVTPPTNGALDFRADGSFDYTPEAPTHSGVFTRVQVQDANLSTALPNPLPEATSTLASSSTHNAFDGDLATSWFSLNVAGEVFYELEFHADITVKEIRMFGTRTSPSGRDFLSGRFRLLNQVGMELYDSGVVALPAPERDLTLSTGVTPNVRRVRFTSSSYEGNDPGFAELHVIGDGEIYESNVIRERRTDGPRTDEVPRGSTQVVVDLDGNDVADILTQTNTAGIFNIRWTAYNGATGTALWQIPAHPFVTGVADPAEVYLSSADSPAVGDIDGDGRPEVLIPAALTNTDLPDRLIALEHDGTFKWLGKPIDTTGGVGAGLRGTGPAVADLDGDGDTEIVAGYVSNRITVFDGNGQVVFHAVGAGNTLSDTTAPVVAPIVSDIDLDGKPEILYGDDAYAFDGTVKWSGTQLGNSGTPKFLGVANLDDDPFGEVVLVDEADRVTVFEHDGILKWRNDDADFHGPFSIADIDGDGQVEIVGSNQDGVRVLEHDGTLKWTGRIVDETIGTRGTTAFDFDADGVMEVLYQDNSTLYFFDGATGRALVRQPVVTFASARAPQSQPLVVDADGDGQAEVLVRESITAEGGIHMFGPKTGTWPETRPVWNQVSCHVTNVNSDGKIPAQEAINWLTPGLNNYRVNVPLPEERTRSRDSFDYKVNDGTFDSNVATVYLEVLPAGNPPRILSQPDPTATVGFPYTYQVFAVDPDVGDVLTFALSSAPAGMTINSATGAITWTPTDTQAGQHPVGITVSDSQGLTALQAYTLTVGQPVIVPDVIGQPQATAEAAITGANLTVGNVTTTTSPTVPAGAVLSQSPAGGAVAEFGGAVNVVVSLGPAPGDVDNDGDGFSENEGDCNDGNDNIFPGASDSSGNGIDENCDGADGVLVLDQIVINPVDSVLLAGNTQAFTATGVFTDGTSQNFTNVVTWESTNTAAASITTAGVATALSGGMTTIRATKNGITDSTTLTVSDQVAGDTTPPTAAITVPASNSTLTEPVQITGTATDANFLKYELAIAPAGETTFTQIAQGAAPVTNSALGTFDPTLLINDLYTVRLTVFDRGGNETVADVVYQVDRDQKVGLFTITFEDLNVAVSGLPVTVNRTYDSRDKRRGDFGVGWRLGVQTLRLRTNRVLGAGWRVVKSGLAFGLLPTDAHKVSLALADGSIEEFDLMLTPSQSAIVPFPASTLTASFTARAGTLGKLQSLENNILTILDPQPGAVELLDDTTLNTYNPQRFRYTALDGTEFVIHKTDGVQSIKESNGNTLIFGPGGVTHSAGKSVTFVRDAQGRITQITDPNGAVRQYAYDANGDLSSSTDQVGNTTRYRYNFTHGLIDIQDPTGNHVARNEYDADGRLIATVDALGNRVEFTHDLNAQQEIVRDRSGNVTVFEYDAAGNVNAQTDALGNRTEFIHDSRGNQLTQTDPLGRIAGETYDAFDNVLTESDFDGNTTTHTYNARGQALTTTDPEGHVTTNGYDTRGNLIQVTDPEGGVTQHTYDAAGNQLSTADPLGNVTTFTYNAFGDTISQTDSLGHVTAFSYDANGNRLSESRTRTLPGGGTQTLTTQFVYDALGRQIKTINPLGGMTITTYDAAGRKQTKADKNGNVTHYDYDTRGNLIETTFADGSTRTSTYDAEGRELSQTDRDGRTTSFAYDALGRLPTTVHPGGASTSTTYDVVGRILTQTDERGNVTTYSYAPNQRTITDALGNSTVHESDGHGRRVKTTDALGRIFRHEYDSRERPTKTIFPDGSTTTITYDALGQKIAETNQAGRTTQFAYDALGRLIRVTDALGGVTVYAYDEVGNRVGQTDAKGHTTRMEYDAAGRLTKRIWPLGQQETFAYDANSNQTSHTDFTGQITTFEYDSSDRPIRKALPGGVEIAYTYTSAGLRTQARGDTYEYDTRGRLIKETKASGEVLTYTYDAAGNRTSVTTSQGTTTYTYDALNRLASVTDASGTTDYTYDAVGTLASTSYPNGAATTYSYDTLNRLVQMVNSNTGGLLSSYTYTLGPAGNRLQVVEAGPATTGRTVSYTYDAVYRLTKEEIDEPGTTNDQTITYTYDAVGNRTQMVRDSVTTTYSYDTNDRLLTETVGATTTTYAYDANGNMTSRRVGATTDTYTYDAENRLAEANLQGGPTPGVVSYTYDVDGVRTSTTQGSITTTYLTDKNRNFAQVLAETTGSTVVTYTYGHDLISQIRSGTGTRFYLTDGQLSTRQLTDGTGAVTDSYTYDAFGVSLVSIGVTPNVYLYAGEQLDANVGFYYLRARYYDQTRGRFISTDPLQGNVFDPISLHRYLYANANPVSFVDPSGNNVLLVVAATFLLAMITLAVVNILVPPPKPRPKNPKVTVDIGVLLHDIPPSVFGDYGPLIDFEGFFKRMEETWRPYVQIERGDAAAVEVKSRSIDPGNPNDRPTNNPVIVLISQRATKEVGEEILDEFPLSGQGGVIVYNPEGKGTQDVPAFATHVLGHCFGLSHDFSLEGNVMNLPPGGELTSKQGNMARNNLFISKGKCL